MIVSQVASLDFYSDEILLSSNGPFLSIYSILTGLRLKQLRVFSKCRILGIKSNLNNIIIWGSKSLAIISNQFILISVVEFKDWIRAVQPLTKNNYAILFSRNFAQLWDLSKGSVLISEIQCEERCLLYAGNMFGDTWEELVIASGAIFNQILIWNTTQKTSIDTPRSRSGDGQVQSRLLGHEGVVYALEFSKDGTELGSVSDDRTIRIYNLSDPRTNAVLRGHNGRVWGLKFVGEYILSISEDASCRVWRRDTHSCVAVWEGHGPKHVWSLAVNPSNSVVVDIIINLGYGWWRWRDTIMGFVKRPRCHRIKIFTSRSFGRGLSS